MDSNPAKKRKASADASTVLPANLSLDDLNRLIDQRATDVVETKTHALLSRVDGLQRDNEALLRR